MSVVERTVDQGHSACLQPQQVILMQGSGPDYAALITAFSPPAGESKQVFVLAAPIRPSQQQACFIATAVGCEGQDLQALRDFRDQHLLGSPTGRFLCRAYYLVGPFAAMILQRSPLLRSPVRRLVLAIADRIKQSGSSPDRNARHRL